MSAVRVTRDEKIENLMNTVNNREQNREFRIETIRKQFKFINNIIMRDHMKTLIAKMPLKEKYEKIYEILKDYYHNLYPEMIIELINFDITPEEIKHTNKRPALVIKRKGCKNNYIYIRILIEKLYGFRNAEKFLKESNYNSYMPKSRYVLYCCYSTLAYRKNYLMETKIGGKSYMMETYFNPEILELAMKKCGKDATYERLYQYI